MAIAIIGGTITATLLTLLVVPSFYDSIEIAHDRLFAKLRQRNTRHNPAVAFLLTMGEAVLTLLMVRMLYRTFRRFQQRPAAA
jgi:hydrophobic/amphiphilic exporter-1 (mainly G- bacteria), HAE1 family